MKIKDMTKISVRQAEKEAAKHKCKNCGNCCKYLPGFFAPSQSMTKLAEFLGITLKDLIENYLIKDNRYDGKMLWTPIAVSQTTHKPIKYLNEYIRATAIESGNEELLKLTESFEADMGHFDYIDALWYEETRKDGITVKTAKFGYPLAVCGHKNVQCVFLSDDNKCKIQKFKPYQCRASHCKAGWVNQWFTIKYLKQVD